MRGMFAAFAAGNGAATGNRGNRSDGNGGQVHDSGIERGNAADDTAARLGRPGIL